TCLILVAYAPSDGTGPDTANIDITSNTGGVAGTHTLIPVTGNPSGGSSLAAVPNLIDFGNQRTNTTSAARTIQILNTGTTAISAVTVSALGGTNPGDFAISQDGCTGQNLVAGGSCLIQTTFTPTVNASGRTASFTVGGTATPAVSNVTVNLTGNGTFPVVSISPIGTIDFGSIQVGKTSSPQTVTVTNISTDSSLHIGTLQQTGTNPGNFTVSSDTCSGAT